MATVDVICDRIHHTHDPRWSARTATGRDVGGGARPSVRVCVACVIELMDSQHVSVVRKSVALTGVGELLKTEGVMREILQQDDRVCVHFTSSLLRMLQCVDDPCVLDKVIQVLVQLLVDLKTEQLVQHVMDELQTLLCDMKCFLACVTFLGRLLDAVPTVSHTLTSTHSCVLESVCARMPGGDEELKAAVCYVLRGVWQCEEALGSLSHTLRERVCVLLLHTFTHACSHPLIANCFGLLLEMLRSGETVCFLMNQGRERQHEELQHCSLPLILKRWLLSADESLQVASVQCVCAVLTHSTQYCSSFIHDDIPEFLLERLSSSSSDVLLWCVYTCVLQLCEDTLFFSQCHSVYGIECVLRSLKVSLKMSNLEVPRQGLQLLSVILERQPAGVRLFPIRPAFVGVAEVVVGGVSSPCLRVATWAARAASALMKMHHQSTSVHYGELKKMVEALSCRFTELPSRSITQRRRCFNTDSESSSPSARAGAFLLQALICLNQTCRLLEECVCEDSVKDRPPTSGDQQNEETLESVCVCVLKCCDTVYIPTVTRVCERSPSARVLQLFLSTLSVQFSLSPTLMPAFANKLASSGFIRLTLEHKTLLCSGNRHVSLNVACCDFLLKLSTCLLSDPESHHLGVEEVECVLRECLPSLYYPVCDWPSVLGEVPGVNQNTQYCLLHLLYLSLLHGDRLLPDPTVFCSVVDFLSAVEVQGHTLPPSVLQASLCLLSHTQGNSSDLDWPPLRSLSKLLSSTPPSCSPLSAPSPSLLHFLFRYPELAERFGTTALTARLRTGSGADPEHTVVMEMMERNPSVLLTLLGVVCEEQQDESVSEQAVGVIRRFLSLQQNHNSVSQTLIKPSLLHTLSKVTCHTHTVHGVSLLMEVLCVVQTNSTVHTDMDHTDFKLLYHISNFVGKMKFSNTADLLPALNYLYCCLALSPTHTADRGLMELLQTLLNLSQSSSPSSSPPSSSSPSSPSSPSSSPSSSPVICCSLLLLSSLVTLQHTHSAQVHKSVCLELESLLRTIMFWKRHTDGLLLGCSVRLLQALLDVDLCSPVVCVSECVELHPLNYRGVISFTTALHCLLIQKQELLLSVSVNCLNSLIHFLNRRRPVLVQHVVCQPWSGFLLYTLLNSGDCLTLHPATLRLLTLLVQWSGDGLQWESDIVCVCESAERRGVQEMSGNTIHTLKRLLIQCSESSLSEDVKLRVERLLEPLDHLRPSESSAGGFLRVGRLSICLADFAVNH